MDFVTDMRVWSLLSTWPTFGVYFVDLLDIETDEWPEPPSYNSRVVS